MLEFALAAFDLAAFGVVAGTVAVKARCARASAATMTTWPPVQALFIDCDDCLYQNNWATARKITASIAAYTERIGVSKDEAYALYQKHGTCLKGLLVESRIDDSGAENFLHEVHQIDYSDIAPDGALKAELQALTAPYWLFTASTSEHAQRCLARLGITDLSWSGVIDTRSCKLETKHARSSFEAAMSIAGVTDPAACVFCDDSGEHPLCHHERPNIRHLQTLP